ncbi:MAG: hypothetical protein JXP36_01540, partial [Bacteroidales bacterium]|nr:hypothetical protein [Bacteroidales bacterium]
FTSKAIITAINENIQESRREWLLWMFERAGSKNGNNSKFQFWQQHNKPIILDKNLTPALSFPLTRACCA